MNLLHSFVVGLNYAYVVDVVDVVGTQPYLNFHEETTKNLNFKLKNTLFIFECCIKYCIGSKIKHNFK